MVEDHNRKLVVVEKCMKYAVVKDYSKATENGRH